MYLINAVVNSKSDKISEFFLKMTPDLQGQSEWKEWFSAFLNLFNPEQISSVLFSVLPYIKNAEENPTFSLHFTKQWQDTLLISLHNFLASIFQYMPKPTLLSFEEDTFRIEKLEQKNESLKSRLALLLDKGTSDASAIVVTPCPVEPPAHLLDDFYVIAQENNVSESQSRGLKNLIRNMSSSTSPILGRKDSSGKKRVGSASRTKSGQSQFYDS